MYYLNGRVIDKECVPQPQPHKSAFIQCVSSWESLHFIRLSVSGIAQVQLGVYK